MRKRRLSMTDSVAEMLAFYKAASDRQEAASREQPALKRHTRKTVAANKQRTAAPIGAILGTRKHRRRPCAGAA
jgi:hypothetical protein